MQIKCLLTCKVAHCFSHHDGKVVHGWSLAPNRHDQFTCLHLLHVRCCSRIPGVTETAGGCFTKVDPWARVGLVVVWWAGSSHRGAGKLCKLRPLRREASFVTMAQSIWPTAEIARKVFSHLLSIYTVYWQTKFSLFDSSVFQRQESRMNFISCLKSVSMRIEVGTLPWLMTEDRDIPILRMAMVYTAHEEPLLRTQARNAMLTLFSKIKIGEGQLLRTALEMAKSRKLGWVIGKSWHCTWHVMPLYWTRWLGKASCWRIYALSRLSHLSFWSICFLTGDGTLLPLTFHTSLVETSMMSLSTFSCILDFPGCRPLCALYCGRIGQTWHKQPKTGMRRLCKNGHFVKRTVFLIPHKGVRDGGRYGTTTFWKAKSKAFARAGCAVLYPQIYVYQNGVNRCDVISWPRLLWSRPSMRSIQQWPTPRQGCRVSMVWIARIAAGPLGPFGRTDQAWHHRHHTDGLWCYCWKSGLEIRLLDSHKGCGSEPLERSLCEAFQKIQQKFFGTVFLGKIGKWIWLHKT